MATTLAKTVLATSPHSVDTPKTRNRTPKDTMVEMTETIVYLKRCLRLGRVPLLPQVDEPLGDETVSGLGHPRL